MTNAINMYEKEMRDRIEYWKQAEKAALAKRNVAIEERDAAIEELDSARCRVTQLEREVKRLNAMLQDDREALVTVTERALELEQSLEWSLAAAAYSDAEATQAAEELARFRSSPEYAPQLRSTAEQQVEEPAGRRRRSTPCFCIDFDGVCHSYTSGWQGATVIPDAPVAGTFEALKGYLDAGYRVAIYSARSAQNGGREAMRAWMERHAATSAGAQEPSWVSKLEFPTTKPPAHVYIDDRGFRFTGTWPSAEELWSMKPWNKQ